MATYLKLDVNIFSLIVLSCIYFKLSNSEQNKKTNLQFLKIPYICIILILILDIFIITLEKNLSNIIFISITKYFLTFANILTLLATFGWIIFLMYYLNPHNKNMKRNIFLATIPFIANLLFSIWNLFFPIYFSITLENGYQRADFFYFFGLFALIHMLFATFIIIKERKKTSLVKFLVLLSLEILPLLGGILQTKFYGTLFTYPFTALALTLIYVGLNDDLSTIDNLSKAYSNKYLTNFLNNNVIDLDKQDYSLVYIDIDGLGKINKKFGEKEGNILLEKFVEIVNDCITEPDFISTAGGDEFIIYFNNNDEKQILNNLKIISRNVEYYNKTSDKPYDIKFTFVYHINTTENASPYKILKNLYLKIANKKQKKLFN